MKDADKINTNNNDDDVIDGDDDDDDLHCHRYKMFSYLFVVNTRSYAHFFSSSGLCVNKSRHF